MYEGNPTYHFTMEGADLLRKAPKKFCLASLLTAVLVSALLTGCGSPSSLGGEWRGTHLQMIFHENGEALVLPLMPDGRTMAEASGLTEEDAEYVMSCFVEGTKVVNGETKRYFVIYPSEEDKKSKRNGVETIYEIRRNGDLVTDKDTLVEIS